MKPTRDVHPRKARRDFLRSKKATVKYSAYRAYKYPTKNFVQYLEREGVETMREVDGYLIEQWKLDRQKDDLAPATFKSNVKHIKTFMNWCESSSLVELGIADKIEIPQISEADQASHEHITLQEAQHVLGYLETYKYASRQHALFYTLWETGCRISGAIALDVSDYDPVNRKLEFVDRKETGTSLKNGPKGERNVTISEDLIGVLNDYIEVNRHDLRDDHNRRPLFTTGTQRLKRQRAYKNVTGFSRPCVYANECPHNKDINTCEAAQKKKQASGCPSSISMHPIRRGSITNHLNQGWPKDKVSDRCDVSIDTLEKHYNEQTKEDEREARMQYVDLL